MNSHGIKVLNHNIPRNLPENHNCICGFRIQNISGKTMHFWGNSAFYGNLSHEHTCRICVFIKEKLKVNALIFEDVIHSGKIATVFFPFQTSGRGSYHLQIIITTGKDTKWVLKYGHTLLDLFVNVRKNVLSVRINRMISQYLFKMSYSEIPIQFKRLQLRIYKTLFHFYDHFKSKRSNFISRLKYNNKKLAFMEKQVRKQKVSSFPCYIGIDTTTKCNNHCVSCFRNYVDINFNEIPDMSEDILNRLILELFPTALTVNISTIGEPLLSSHIEKILNACLEYHVCLSFTTNGTLLKGDVFLDKLAKVLHHIEISFDSASPELFEKLRPNSRYSEVLQNANNLGKIRSTMMGNKFNMGFSMTLFRENLTEIPEVLRIISDIGGNFLKTDFGVIFTKQDLKRSVINYPDLYNEIYHISQEEARKLGIRLLMRSPFLENGHSHLYNKGICDYLYLSACINSQGELKPCYFQLIPSLKVNKNFIAIWNNKMMQSLRLEHDTSKKQKLCRDCYLIIQGKDSIENRKKQFLKGDASKWKEVINFAKDGNAKLFTVTGWSDPESTFTWTDGKVATFCMPVSFHPSNFVTLKAVVSAFIIPVIINKQTVQILINGKAICIWFIDKPNFQEKFIFIPKDLILKSNQIEIRFITPDAVSPALVGYNNDKRVLGIALQSIELTE